MHGEKNTGDDLDHQDQQRQGAKDVPEIEIFRSVVLRHVHFVGIKRGGEPVFKPVGHVRGYRRVGGEFLEFSHVLYS